MASALKYPAALRNAFLDSITSRAGASAKLRIYSGTQPATADTALSGQTLLADLTCNATFAPSASGGVLTLNAITQDSSADASGTASFFRLWNSAVTVIVCDGSVSTSAADLNLNSTTITAGNPVAVSSFTITAPNA